MIRSFRISDDINLNEVKELAEAEGNSLNGLINDLLLNYLHRKRNNITEESELTSEVRMLKEHLEDMSKRLYILEKLGICTNNLLAYLYRELDVRKLSNLEVEKIQNNIPMWLKEIINNDLHN